MKPLPASIQAALPLYRRPCLRVLPPLRPVSDEARDEDSEGERETPPERVENGENKRREKRFRPKPKTRVKQGDQETQGQDIHSESPGSRHFSGVLFLGSEQSCNELTKEAPHPTNWYEADCCPVMCSVFGEEWGWGMSPSAR